MFDRAWFYAGHFPPGFFPPDYRPRKKKRKGGMSYQQALAATLAYRAMLENELPRKKRSRRRRQVERMTLLSIPAASFPFL